MNLELTSGAILVVLLLAVAGYFSVQEIRKLRRSKTEPAGSEAEQLYVRRQAWRRLVCCGLLVVLAGLLIGAFLLEGSVQGLIAQGREGDGEWNPEQRDFFRVYSIYWIVTLLVLLGIITLAAFDLWVIRRFSLREHRRIMADRREMIEREVRVIRQQRNGKQ